MSEGSDTQRHRGKHRLRETETEAERWRERQRSLVKVLRARRAALPVTC